MLFKFGGNMEQEKKQDNFNNEISYSISLSKDEWEKIDYAAKRLDIDRSMLIKRLLQKFFENPEC